MAKTHHLEPRLFHYTYGPAEPALVVMPGDTVVTKGVFELKSELKKETLHDDGHGH